MCALMRALALLIVFLSLAASAQAVCPPAPVGKPSDSVVQFVTSGTAGFGPTTSMDATREGAVVYDPAAKTLKVCDGTDWVGLGGPGTALPSFSVHRNGVTQGGIVSGVSTKVDWTHKAFDTNNDFNLATDRFTPTVPGTYLLNLQVYCQTTSWCGALVLKNGTTVQESWSVGSSTVSANTVALVVANGTDYFEAYVYMAGNNLYGNHYQTYFSGTMLPTHAGGGGTVPTGAVMAFDLAACPAGWSEYTPARGRFLRGIDNGAGNDPSGTRAVGNVQADAMQQITGQFRARGNTTLDDTRSGAFSGSSSGASVNWLGASPSLSQFLIDFNSANSPGARTANETRPKNVAVLYCRKS